MAKIPYKKIPRKLAASAALVALLGGAAGLTINFIAEKEGYVPEVYLDPAGIPTQCFGDIYHIQKGKKPTFEQCEKLLNNEVYEHARNVARCVPGVREMPGEVMGAFTSMAYNIGSGAFCKSKVAQYANSGQWLLACKQIAKGFTTAGGKTQPGLVKRRGEESAMCLAGLSKMSKGRVELK